MTTELQSRTKPQAHPDKLATAIQLAKLGFTAFSDLVGVYVMVNKETGRVYVGQTVHMRRRVGVHMTYMSSGRHTAPVREDYAKHGAASFGFAIVHACEVDELEELEREYISFALAGTDCYNRVVYPINGGRRSRKLLTEDQRLSLQPVRVVAWIHKDDAPEFKAKAKALAEKLAKERAKTNAAREPAKAEKRRKGK